jgi:hemolysin III
MASLPEYPFEPDAVYLPDTVFPPLHEEVVNTVTHGLGLALAAVGTPWLVSYALERGTPWHVIGCGVFGATMLAVYAASTLYHGVQERRAKHFFRVVDHVCIYLMIAGTYTPFALVEGGTWGWTILTLVWLFAAWGVFFKITRNDRLDAMSYLPYVALGWLVLVAAKPICETFPWHVLAWIGAGGVFYTAGVYFVAADRRFYHSIWHLFVLAGSACHFLAVMHYLEFRAV